jgi:hypothetical protein
LRISLGPRSRGEGWPQKSKEDAKKGNGLGAAFFALVCDSCGKTSFGSWGVVVRGSHAKPRRTRRRPGTKAGCLLCVPPPLREHRSFARAHGMERIPRGDAERGGRKNRKKTQKRETVVVPPFCASLRFLRRNRLRILGRGFRGSHAKPRRRPGTKAGCFPFVLAPWSGWSALSGLGGPFVER